MASMLRRAAAWIGLTGDDEDYVDDVEQYSEPIYRSDDSVVTPIHREEVKAVSADLSRIITVHPRIYNEARAIGEQYRQGMPVIMNLSSMEESEAKRLVDFASGLTFGLCGTIERVTSKVFLLSPNNVSVTAEDKERIKGGFYNQS